MKRFLFPMDMHISQEPSAPREIVVCSKPRSSLLQARSRLFCHTCFPLFCYWTLCLEMPSRLAMSIESVLPVVMLESTCVPGAELVIDVHPVTLRGNGIDV